MESGLFQAMIYLGAAVLAVPLAARLGLGSVLGYLAAGIAIGPVFGLVGSETEELRHVAEFGVVMMLFLIGLELAPRALWDMRHKLLGLGGLQVLLTSALIAAGGLALGLRLPEAIAAGLILSLSSTAIVLQTLTEKGLVQSEGGRSIFAVLLTQDIAVIPMLALLPLLGSRAAPGEGADHGAEAHAGAANLVAGLPPWAVTLVTLAAIAGIVLIGTYATRPVFRYIHHARLREMYTAFALLLVVGAAVLMGLVGLSAALGTFLAGVVLAGSEFRHEIESDLEPFKGMLLGLFFITVGAGIDFGLLFSEPGLLALLTLGLIVVKAVVLYVLARVFRMARGDRRLFALALAQAGEFGFVLISFSLATGVLGTQTADRMLLVIALSMLATPVMFLALDAMARREAVPVAPREADPIDEDGPVIIAGVGRFGQVVNRLVRSSGFRTVVLDNDLGTVETLRQFGIRGFFGDPTRPDVLKAAGFDTARVLVVALDDKEAATRLVRWSKANRPDLHIVARAYDRVHVYELFAAGADDIVREMFDSSLRAGRYVLENLGLSDYEAAEAETAFYHMDRAGLKELAKLWVPGVPNSKNPDFVKRAKELNSELEAALVTLVTEGRPAQQPPDEDYRVKT